jgi:hypothetical protein
MEKIYKSRAISEVISTLLLLMISVFGASVLAIFVNNFFDAGVFSQADLQRPQNLFLVGYDARDNSDLLGFTEIDNVFTSPGILVKGQDHIILQIQNKGLESVHIYNVFIDGVQHTWDSATLDKSLQVRLPASGTFSMFLSSQSRIQTSTDIPSGKTAYVVITLSTSMTDLPIEKFVNVKIDEKGLDSENFVIRTGQSQ